MVGENKDNTKSVDNDDVFNLVHTKRYFPTLI